MANNQLRNLIFDVESNTGNILSQLETFEALSGELNLLRQKMDVISSDSDHGKRLFHYEEVYRKIKLFDELIHFSLNDLNKSYEATEKNVHELFKLVTIGENNEDTE